MIRRLQVLLLFLALACGGSSDLGPYPLIESELVPLECEDEGFDCFTLVITAKGEGSSLGTCQVYAQDVDFTSLAENETDAAYETEQFAFTSGQVFRFPVKVAQIDDERFLRWASRCDPGRRA